MISDSYPLNTERKLNVHEKFKRRPGHLLNDLYKFNLRPVSSGLKCMISDYRRIATLPHTHVLRVSASEGNRKVKNNKISIPIK